MRFLVFMAMKDSPEIVTIEFGSSHVISSTDLIGMYVDHESACNRFKVREINTGGQEWTLSDLQPLYGHQFRGGDLEIKVASPLKSDDFQGFTGARLLLVRRAHTCQEYLPNLPLVPISRPTTRIVRQRGKMPDNAAAAFSVASAYIEGYRYVSCMFGIDNLANIVGAEWQIVGWGPSSDGSTVDSAQVFATIERPFAFAIGKGNGAPPVLVWDLLSVAVEPFPFQKVELFIFNVPPAFLTDPAPAVIWQFSNETLTERF